jgi:tetratricopeptide (TPR) repeat protein
MYLMNGHAELAKLDLKKKTQIFKALGGHPWTIGMFARHASTKGADSLLLELEPVKKELREFTLFDKSYSMLDAASRELLIRASIFEEAVPVVALRWMMGDESQKSPSVDEPLEKLMHWGLMARQDEIDGTLYSVHTLVREFAGKEAEGQKADRKKLLARAAQYYENKTEVSQSLWDLMHAREYYYRAGEWDQAANIAIDARQYLACWGHIELAMNILNQSVKTTSGTKKAIATGQLANMYQGLGDWKTALKLHSEVKEIFEKEGDRRNVAAALHQLGMIHQLQGNYAEAANLYQQSLDLFKVLGDKQGFARSLHQLGMIHQDQGNYAEAAKLYRQSLDIMEELGDRQGIANSLGQLGNNHYLQGNYTEAAKLYQQILDIFKELGDKNGIANCLYQLGMIHQNQGNYA